MSRDKIFCLADPLFCSARRVWDLLHKLSREKGTPVFLQMWTSEGVRHADTVAFWYRDRMLFQDSPDRLLKDFECHNFEDVCLKACLKYEEGLVYARTEAFPEVLNGNTEQKDRESAVERGENVIIPPLDSS